MVTVPADAECRAARYIDRAAAPDAVSPYAVAAPAAPEISSLRRVIRGLPTSAGGEAGVSSDMSFLLRSRKRSGSDRTAPDRSGKCRLEHRTIATSVSSRVRNAAPALDAACAIVLGIVRTESGRQLPPRRRSTHRQG